MTLRNIHPPQPPHGQHQEPVKDENGDDDNGDGVEVRDARESALVQRMHQRDRVATA